jgi:glucosamine--fructose-6-phosphate aminotransferase (isomerizing)
MCGIVGYIGSKNCVPIILEGLRRLEYRGYDSAGIALIRDDVFFIQKNAGKVADLALELGKADGSLFAHIGVDTRWATHGEPNDINAHPHWDQKKQIALVHNGIIENYLAIKTKLLRDGHTFLGATDTEVLAHLVGVMFDECGELATAVRLALAEVQGTYGIVVISPRDPKHMIAARRGSPLLIGVGEGENYVASDASALSPTRGTWSTWTTVDS